MKILFASATPLAGVCELNARLVNELYPGVHEARVLNNGPGRHAWYLRSGVRIRTYKLSHAHEARAALEWADSIACQANVGARNLAAEDLIRKKHWSFIWHGAEINGCLDRSFKPEHYKYVRFLHIGQGWIERQADFFFKFDLRVVPNLISIDDEIHRPAPWPERIKRVAFAPSNTRAKAVNDKGVALTERIFSTSTIPLKVLYRKPFEDCMREKRRSQLGLDEVATAMYHRSGLEFLSQGVPCICRTDEKAEAVLKDVTGADRNPFINADFNTLRACVEEYMARPEEERKALSIDARSWIDTYYSPRALLERHYLPAYGLT